MGEACSVYGREGRFLVRKPKGKSPLRGPMLRVDDNIKMDLQEVGCG
jgi:hypothetical protein